MSAAADAQFTVDHAFGASLGGNDSDHEVLPEEDTEDFCAKKLKLDAEDSDEHHFSHLRNGEDSHAISLGSTGNRRKRAAAPRKVVSSNAPASKFDGDAVDGEACQQVNDANGGCELDTASSADGHVSSPHSPLEPPGLKIADDDFEGEYDDEPPESYAPGEEDEEALLQRDSGSVMSETGGAPESGSVAPSTSTAARLLPSQARVKRSAAIPVRSPCKSFTSAFFLLET